MLGGFGGLVRWMQVQACLREAGDWHQPWCGDHWMWMMSTDASLVRMMMNANSSIVGWMSQACLTLGWPFLCPTTSLQMHVHKHCSWRQWANNRGQFATTNMCLGTLKVVKGNIPMQAKRHRSIHQTFNFGQCLMWPVLVVFVLLGLAWRMLCMQRPSHKGDALHAQS